MAFSYYFTQRARLDFDGILKYIAIDLSNPIAANKFFDDVVQAINLICEFPTMCPLYESHYIHLESIRYKRINNYLLFYDVDEVEKTVRILTIVYSKRNLKENLKDI